METWRLITTWDAEPGWNMALDEALLGGDDQSPTLRFYTWRPDTLSLGYFQRFAQVPGTDRAGAVVRRMTGGGAIHHAHELTFSITAPARHALYRGPVAESYARVHAAIAAALLAVDVPAQPRGAAALASDRPDTGMCFHLSTPLDLCWDGRKGVGSAQRRTGGRVLHHGSIKLGTTPLEGDIATVWERAPDERLESLAERVAGEMARRFDAVLEPADATVAEKERARARAAFFVSQTHLRRR